MDLMGKNNLQTRNYLNQWKELKKRMKFKTFDFLYFHF